MNFVSKCSLKVNKIQTWLTTPRKDNCLLCALGIAKNSENNWACLYDVISVGKYCRKVGEFCVEVFFKSKKDADMVDYSPEI